MGIKRMLWRSTGVGAIIDTAKNVADEGNLVKGIKRTVKENYCEDNPFTSIFYNAGKHDGKVEGYEQASNEYEKKLLEQADKFLKQTRIFESEKKEYEQLLDEYEKEIYKLTNKVGKAQRENQYLQQLLLRERKLLKMSA